MLLRTNRLFRLVPCLVASAAFCVADSGLALTIPELSRARQEAEKSRTLSETEKKQVADMYGKAIHSLESAVGFKAAQLGQERLRASLEGMLAALRTETSKPASRVPPPSEEVTAQQVQEALSLARTETLARRKAIDDLTRVSVDLSNRREAIQLRAAAIINELQSLEDQLAAIALTAAAPQWTAAARAQIQSRKQELEQEQASLTAEKDAIAIRRTLIPVQREYFSVLLDAAIQNITDLKQRLETARRREALRELQGARDVALKAASFSPILEPTAREVQELATRLWGADGVLDASQRTAAESDRLSQQAERVVQVIANTRLLYVSFPPFAPARGWLRQIPRNLPQLIPTRRARLFTMSALPTVQREVVDLEDRSVSEAALESQIQELKVAAARSVAPPNDTEFETQARSLLQLRRILNEALLHANQDYERALGLYDTSSGRLLHLLGELNAFVSARILWARSVSGDLIPSRKGIVGGLAWLLLNEDWPNLWRALLPWQPWYPTFLAAAALLSLLFLLRPRWRARLQASAKALSDPANGRFRPLRSALISTILLTAAWPAVLLLIHWVLLQREDYDLARDLASGFRYAAGSLFACLFFRSVLSEGGIAEVHLGWSRPLRETLSRPLRCLTPALPVLYFIVMALREVDGLPTPDPQLQTYRDSLGRVCCLAMLCCLLLAAWRMLRPGGTVAASLLDRYSSSHALGWRIMSKRAVSVLLLLIPVLLVLTGYYFTARLYAENLFQTAMLTTGWASSWR